MNRRQIFPVTGLLATFAIAVYMLVQLQAQDIAPAGDYSNAAVAEVRDAQGQVVLRGQFVAVDEDDDDIERKATLEATGVDADAAGTAEVEASESHTRGAGDRILYSKCASRGRVRHGDRWQGRGERNGRRTRTGRSGVGNAMTVW